jgi:TRAP-type C4-dicarboxylate transport system permease large subunit
LGGAIPGLMIGLALMATFMVLQVRNCLSHRQLKLGASLGRWKQLPALC